MALNALALAPAAPTGLPSSQAALATGDAVASFAEQLANVLSAITMPAAASDSPAAAPCAQGMVRPAAALAAGAHDGVSPSSDPLAPALELWPDRTSHASALR